MTFLLTDIATGISYLKYSQLNVVNSGQRFYLKANDRSLPSWSKEDSLKFEFIMYASSVFNTLRKAEKYKISL
jgi:hypothetical protein